MKLLIIILIILIVALIYVKALKNEEPKWDKYATYKEYKLCSDTSDNSKLNSANNTNVAQNKGIIYYDTPPSRNNIDIEKNLAEYYKRQKEIEKKREENEKIRREQERLQEEYNKRQQEIKKYVAQYEKITMKKYDDIIQTDGERGELETYTSLCDYPDSSILVSLVIPIYKNSKLYKYTEIDQILITHYGIYVIEIKNKKVSWNIKGYYKDGCECKGAQNSSWEKEQNPLYQNQHHVEALKGFLIKENMNQYSDYIYNCVVFGKNTISIRIIDGYKCVFGTCYEIKDKLNEFEIDKSECLNDDDISKLSEILLPYQCNPELKMKHAMML